MLVFFRRDPFTSLIAAFTWLMLLMTVVASGTVTAASATGHARVHIQSSLSMHVQQQLAVEGLRGHGGVNCAVQLTGSLRAKGCSATASLGELLISGPDHRPVSIVVQRAKAEDQVLDVSSALFTPTLKSDATPILAAGRAKVLVGGDLKLESIPEQHQQLTYIIRLNYN